MRWALVLAVGLVVLVGARAGVAPAAAGGAPAAAGAVDWAGDLDYLVSELPKRHKNAFFRIGPEEWERAARELKGRLGGLSDAAAVVELQRLAAMLGDAHTGVTAGGRFAQRAYPLGFAWFDDGVFVTRATAEHAELVGMRLVRVAETPVEEAAARAAGVFAHENEMMMKGGVPRMLATPEVVSALGLVGEMERGEFVLAGADGAERRVVVAPLAAGANAEWVTKPAAAGMPLWLRKGPATNWCELLEELGTVYCRYDRCGDEPGKTVAQFCEEALALVDGEGVKRVVVDLRNNGGGNSALLMPLIDGLRQRKERLGPGGVIVLIGRRTFSSAQLNAVGLKKAAGAVLIGEPTGQKPNAYGEVRTFTLPSSGLTVRYSTKYFKTDPGDAASTKPDVAVGLTSAEYFAGRDPVLEAAVAYRAGE